LCDLQDFHPLARQHGRLFNQSREQ